jgi:hypothetical protein
MVEKKKGDGSHSMWNKKGTQGKGKNHHRLKLPPPPLWVDANIAHLEGCSRLRLIYNANDFDALGQGPVGLSNLVGLTNHGAPLLSPPPPEWRQSGFMVLREEGIVVPGLGRLVSLRWLFALEWDQTRSAWDALLFSLDHILLKAFALPPMYVLPAFFVVCMADRPDDSMPSSIVASWGSLLEETCKRLDAFLLALYEYWMDGPSTSAFRYRQFVEHVPTDGADYRHLIDPFTSFIGPEALEAIRCTEHVEATVMRQLRQMSSRLWSKGCLPFQEQELPTFLNSSHLHALLPLALWQSPSLAKQSLDVAQLHSLDDVLHSWKQHMGIG